ncbi:MAG: DUF2442 domain-containing protein [Sulfuricellaceae bacterium]|nr:DUF2442 domain-containing protein [Sulfuricellaceae bacterium]
MNPYVATALPLEDHVLLLTFTNGEQRVFDTKPYLDQGVFKRLRERSLFLGVRVVAGSVEWPGEIDLSYDTLYLGSHPVPAVTGEPA